VSKSKLIAYSLIIVLSLLDVATTYFLVFKYNCRFEFNVLVRELCVVNRELVFIHVIVESAGFILLYEIALRVKEKFKLKYRVELTVLILLALAVLNNTIGLILGN